MLFATRCARLEEDLARLPSLLIALSGGVDSAALLGAAARALPGRVLAATTRSPAVPDEEVATAAAVAALFGVPHRILDTQEMESPLYRANTGDRCYHCRREMYGRLRGVAAREGIGAIADGLQAEDLLDDRPGVRAAEEQGILHPLRDHGFRKAETRRLARALGWGGHDRPAQPCLASRLPPGIPVTVERLERVHRAEQAVRALGLREVRVRCEDRHGRVEIGRGELGAARAIEARILSAVLAAGFASAALDPLGYRGGSLRP